MKKVSVLCIMLFGGIANADVVLYYDAGGNCPADKLYLGGATSCDDWVTGIKQNALPTQDSKTFKGFYMGDTQVFDKNGAIKASAETLVILPESQKTATAKFFESDETVNVTLNYKGGTGDTSIEAEPGDILPKNVPNRLDGATFGGWYKNGESESSATINRTVDVATGSSVTYNAKWNCPDGTSMNSHGVCVEPDGEYFDRSGNSRDPANLACWGPNGERYCYPFIYITFHDKPTSGASSINVTYLGNKSNDGQTLDCSGGQCKSADWCYENEPGYKVCRRINMPHSVNNEWTFRGYYFDTPSDLITQKSTTDGGAFSVFYPKNISTNNDNISITERNIIVTSNTALQEDSRIDIDLYGGWARSCTDESSITGTNTPNCRLQIGTSWNVTDGLGKGDVRYVNNCPAGQHVDPDTAGYNHNCVADSGSANVIYNFVNQYGETVPYCAISQPCDTGSNYSMLSNTNFANSCSGRGTLYWLKTNGQYYSPNYTVMCSSNVFGSNFPDSPASVTGYVCDATCNDGAGAPANGKCEDIEDTSIQYDYHTPGGYYGGTLWGAWTSPHNQSTRPACKKLTCGEGYTIWTGNDNKKTCITEYEACIRIEGEGSDKCAFIGLNCPATNTLSPASGVVVGQPVKLEGQSGPRCQYSVGCSDSDAVLMFNGEGAGTGSHSISCVGDDCKTTTALANDLVHYTCFACPSTAMVPYSELLTIGEPSITPTNLINELTCSYNVSCKNNQSEVLGQATCTSGTTLDTQCYKTMGNITPYLNLTNSINGFASICGGEQGSGDDGDDLNLEPAFTVPDDVTGAQ